jgi:2'-5' RNA ligase
MKYFVGVKIPDKFKEKIELVRAEARFFSTEPHITLIPPPVLPDEDDFIKELIEVCKNTKSFRVRLGELGQFGSRVLYVSVDSPELKELHDRITENLKLEKEKRGYVPHLTVIKQRPGRPVDIDAIRKKSEIKLSSPPEYTLESVVIFAQPKEKSIYVPYMEIPFGN